MKTTLYQLIFEDIIKTPNREYDGWFSREQNNESRTNRVDFGRQTGKTTAIINTVVNHNDDFNFVVITHHESRARAIADQIKFKFSSNRRIPTGLIIVAGNSTERITKIADTIRNSKTRDKRTVVFIEEPMKRTTEILDEIFEKLNVHKVFVVGCQ